MHPLSLTLKGFRGIRDGLGRDALTLDFERLADGAELIAIAGVNGRGKTTVMDNMHPYLTMPSRAVAAGPGGFSYYDHVVLPENEKDLTWAHEGRSYRSQVVIRLGSRRRTEAFLHAMNDAGQWQPVRLPDGTLSDGKLDTYTRCVEALCGSAETFFTSVFSAQGKRQLNSYRNAEIKALLADLLGQDEVIALGQKASETARLLKAGLAVARHELTGLDDALAHQSAERTRLAGATDRVTQHGAARHAAQAAFEAAQGGHSRLAAEREHAQATEARRAQLMAERSSLGEASNQAIAALNLQDQGEQLRLERLQQRIAMRTTRERARREALQAQRRQCAAVLASDGLVRRATERLPLAERLLGKRRERIAAARTRADEYTQCRAAERHAEESVGSIEREAGKAALRAEELKRRFGLTGEVPCVGTDLQGQCKLLGDAREAQALIPDAQAQLARLHERQLRARQTLVGLRGRLAELASARGVLAHAEDLAESAEERVRRWGRLAAKAGEVASATAALSAIDEELAALGQCGDPQQAPQDLPEDQAERLQIAQARAVIAQQRDRQTAQFQASLTRIDAALAALPAPYDARQLQRAAQALTLARQTLAAAEVALAAAQRDALSLEHAMQQWQQVAGRRAVLAVHVGRIETEIGGWNLFARCMSHDGLIALAIDDAGPTLSALANDLLLACYGPRFTVAIHTLVETSKGDQKEGFDIVVHDGESGDSKSVGLMSGGERVWINECLTRAVALYLAQHSGRQYATLFSDEADGALDPERKRMFMAMKREVLRLGGYEREFFVSQTPELTAMADAVIDLEALRADSEVSAEGIPV